LAFSPKASAVEPLSAFYPAGSTPLSVAVADANHDGKPDLLVADGCGDPACRTTGVVSVMAGRGDGTFGNRKQYPGGPAGTSADYVAASDFNHDGNVDVAVVNSKVNFLGTVSVLLGKADGSFELPVPYSVDSVPVSVVIGDFNGDSNPDLAVVNASPDDVSILLGKGDGTFQTAVNFPTEVSPHGIATGDFNGAGHLDLAVVNECGTDPMCHTGSVSILLGDGNGSFQTGPTATANAFPLSVAVGDFNHDGKLDLAVANACGTDYLCVSPGSVAILLGNGDATFQSAVNFSTVDFDTVFVATGDFNGDGKPDLAAVNYVNASVSVLAGRGDGTFRAASTFAVGSNPISVTAGKLNRDGSADIIVPNEFSNTVTVFLGK